MRNLNINSDEAHDLATFIAKRTGKSLTLVVTEALAKEKRELTRDELKAKWMRITDEIAARMTPEQRTWDYDAEMYDEDGLPI
jgi:antitoxin VapB